MRPQLTVIITTYNQPDWLHKVLEGYEHQTFRDFEMIVADDGSSNATASLVAAARDRYHYSIRHLWQDDDGFRKCRILNKAILESKGDYLVFSDGDCIPRRDFLQTHADSRRPDAYLSGGYVKLPQAPSLAIDDAAIRCGDHCRYTWLRRHGLRRFENLRKLCARPPLAQWMNTLSTVRAGWHGHNASCWKADALRVNGFDERMGWGGEDREFGYRLVNAGIHPRRIRYSAICVHLHHGRPWRDDEVLARNDQLREETRRSGRVRTDHGISELQREVDRSLFREVG